MALAQLAAKAANPRGAPTGDAQGHPDAPPSAMKGEYMPPNASPKVQKYVAQARVIMYAPQAQQALRAAITGSQDLASSAAPFIASLVMKLEDKMGPLSDQEYLQVVSILAASVAHLAHDMHDPAAQLPSDATMQITKAVMQLHQQQKGAQPQQPPPQQQAPQGSAPPQAMPQPQGAMQ